jgi:hypothetical protein
MLLPTHRIDNSIIDTKKSALDVDGGAKGRVVIAAICCLVCKKVVLYYHIDNMISGNELFDLFHEVEASITDVVRLFNIDMAIADDISGRVPVTRNILSVRKSFNNTIACRLCRVQG